MKRRIISKIATAVAAILFSCGLVFVNGNARASGGQTPIGHLNSDGTVSLLVADTTLETAFAQDADSDIDSTYWGATFDSIYVTYFTDTFYVVGVGSNSNYPNISRYHALTLNPDNTLTLCVAVGSSNCSGKCTQGCNPSPCQCGLSDSGGGGGSDENGSCSGGGGGPLGGNLGNLY